MSDQKHGIQEGNRRWIPVTEESMPAGIDPVLVFWRGAPGTDTFGVARHEIGDPAAHEHSTASNDRWVDLETGETWGQPTHWMPLPQAPDALGDGEAE